MFIILCSLSLSFGGTGGTPKKWAPDVYMWEDSAPSYTPGATHDTYWLWVPDSTGNTVIRGVFLTTNNAQGYLCDWVMDPFFRKFAKKFNFGIFSCNYVTGDSLYKFAGPKILQAFKDWSTMGHTPELANIPFISVGESNGGTAAYSMAMLAPERCIALCAGLVYHEYMPFLAPDAGVRIPSVIVNGSYDQYLDLADSVMLTNRARGALWSHMVIWGCSHELKHMSFLFYPFMEKMINTRLPADANPRLGPVTLNTIPEQSGWLADPTSWTTGFTDIAAYDQYTKDKAKADWLSDADMAFLYRSYSSANVKLNLHTPDSLPFTNSQIDFWHTNVFKPGETITFVVNASSLPAWIKIVLYRGATKVDSIVKGNALEFKVKAPASPICQSYSLLGYDGSSKVYPANMFTVLVMDDSPYSTTVNRGVRSMGQNVHQIGNSFGGVWDLRGRMVIAPDALRERTRQIKTGPQFSNRLNRVYIIK
jgi:hypothetical protein